jgi:hypothetical protein
MGKNERMVSPALSFPTILSRLDFVRSECRAPSKSDFSKWIGAASPQAVNGWETRDSLPTEPAKAIAKVTGASLAWLLTGEGEAFPKGAIPFPGVVPSSADYRLRAAEDQIDALSTVMVVFLQTFSAKLPDVASELAQALRGLPGDSGSKRQLLEAAAGAVEVGLRSSGQAAPPAGRRVSAGKPRQR